MAVRIYITERDQKVLRFVEEYGSITISQAHKMFYSEPKYGYDIARRRLKKLVTYNKLRVGKDNISNQNVYYMDKKLSYHDLLVLDFYAELVKNGAEISYFKTRKPWMNGKCISDAYCCYGFNGTVYFNIVEVVRTHFIDVDKYLSLYKSGEPQKFNSMIYNYLGGDSEINEFPRVIVIDNVRHKKDIFIHEDVKVYQLDFNMNGFARIFL